MLSLLFLAFAAVQEPAVAPQDARTAMPQMRTAPDPAAPPRVGISLTQRKLALADAIEMALANNLEIDIEKTNRDTAAQQVQAARGFFDPTFRWQPLLSTVNTPTGSVLQGSSGKLTDRSFAQNFYLRQKVQRSGSLLSLDFENARQTTTNPFTSFNPILASRLAIGVTQPLLRGFRIDRDRAELRIRRKRVEGAQVDFELRVIDVIGRVEQAYWDLVAARQDIAVREDAVRWAREQLALNQRLVNSGTLAPVELSAAEAELQRRLDNWYSAVGLLTEVENNLKTLIAPERTASIWGDEIIPMEVQNIEAPEADNVPAAVTQALKLRPELRSVEVRRQVNDVEKELNANLRKPEVNLVGQYSLNGIGGSLTSITNPFTESNIALLRQVNELSVRSGLQPLAPTGFGAVPEFLIGNYGTALSNLFGGRYQSFQAGLSFDLTLRNRTAQANYGQSLINEKRLKLERARAEQAIEAQVRNALQGIETARQRITAAQASATAAKEKLDSELRLYQTGESTNFLVLTRQNEFSDSRRREVVARLDLNKSVSRLRQALGTTLQSYKVSVQ